MPQWREHREASTTHFKQAFDKFFKHIKKRRAGYEENGGFSKLAKTN
jgi:hypothetical protein